MLDFLKSKPPFDPTRRAVRFWGHDSAMEWSFFVTEEALKRLQPNMGDSEPNSFPPLMIIETRSTRQR